MNPSPPPPHPTGIVLSQKARYEIPPLYMIESPHVLICQVNPDMLMLSTDAQRRRLGPAARSKELSATNTLGVFQNGVSPKSMAFELFAIVSVNARTSVTLAVPL